MAARAYWKGFLRLSLVSIAVEIYNAVETKSEISFRQIHKPTGRRINYTKTVQGVGEIDNADIVKGYEVDADTYVTLEPEEIDAVKLESKKTIDLVKFVDAAEIDPRYFERPYFIAPADKHSGEGYVVIREALKKTGKVGLAQLTIAGREWLVAIAPFEDGLLMEMLRYAEELKDATDFFDEVPIMQARQGDGRPRGGAHRAQGRQVHARRSSRTTTREALRELVNKKMKGQKVIAPHEEVAPGGGKVIDLMAALRKSIGDGGKTKPKAKAKGTSDGKRTKTKAARKRA